MKHFIKIFFLFLIFKVNFVFAEIIKPNNGIEPYQVVKIQLRGLMKNDNPKMDTGIEQTWEFAHPNNKAITGPINRFKNMIYSKDYKILLGHENYEIKILSETEKKSVFQVFILSKEKEKYYYIWQIEKVLSESAFKMYCPKSSVPIKAPIMTINRAKTIVWFRPSIMCGKAKGNSILVNL